MHLQEVRIQGTLAAEANLTRNNIPLKDFQDSLDCCPKFAQFFKHQRESRYIAEMAFLFSFAFWLARNKQQIENSELKDS